MPAQRCVGRDAKDAIETVGPISRELLDSNNSCRAQQDFRANSPGRPQQVGNYSNSKPIASRPPNINDTTTTPRREVRVLLLCRRPPLEERFRGCRRHSGRNEARAGLLSISITRRRQRPSIK